MRRMGFTSIMLMAAAMGADLSGILPRRRQRPPEPDHDPLAVACPTCKRPEGEPCNPATLGRFQHHRARVEAAEAAVLAATSNPIPDGLECVRIEGGAEAEAKFVELAHGLHVAVQVDGNDLVIDGPDLYDFLARLRDAGEHTR